MMANQGGKTPPEAPQFPALGLDQFNQYGQLGFDSFARANSVVLKGMTEMSTELMRFANTRLQSNMETVDKIGQCRDVGELLDCEWRHAETLARHYADETTKLLNMTAELARQIWGQEAEPSIVSKSKQGKAAASDATARKPATRKKD